MPVRIILQVPYAQKDLAKAQRAKWDPAGRTWFVELKDGDSGIGLDKLAQWTRPVDKRFLDCPQEHLALAEKRGAIRDQQTGRLFVPSWYANAHWPGEKLYRLCYWLPVCEEFCQTNYRIHRRYRQLFANDSDAGLFIAGWAPYTCRDLYLPGERLAMDRLCAASSGWYICTADPKSPYYRHQQWDMD